MLTDSYKGITNIRYNHNLLPDKVTLTNGRTIEWVMTATGETLRKVVKQNGTTLLTRDYIDGIEYLDGVMEAIYHSEGRVKYTNGTARYEYTLRDHLGNGRVYYTDLDGNGIGTPSDILQSESYYAFGLQIDDPRELTGNPVNPYQYNGKELNTDFGLNWHAYGARYYDAAVGRFVSVDPLSEEAPDWTPYRYAFNNPIQFIDPDGMFEDKAAAKKHAKDNNIKLRPKSFLGKLFTSGSRSNIVENSDGTYSIEHADGSFTQDLGGDLGIQTGLVVTPTDVMSVESEGNNVFGYTETATLRDGSSLDVTPITGDGPDVGPGKFGKYLRKSNRVNKVKDLLKGGNKAARDRNFGIRDKRFWKAWEKHKQKLPGKGREKDIKSSKQARELYEKWKNGNGF